MFVSSCHPKEVCCINRGLVLVKVAGQIVDSCMGVRSQYDTCVHYTDFGELFNRKTEHLYRFLENWLCWGNWWGVGRCCVGHFVLDVRYTTTDSTDDTDEERKMEEKKMVFGGGARASCGVVCQIGRERETQRSLRRRGDWLKTENEISEKVISCAEGPRT